MSTVAPAERPARRLGTLTPLSARTAAGRTARVWLGLLLGLTPLFSILDDRRWFVLAAGASLVAVGPAWVLRWRAERHGPATAHVWHLVPGVVLLPFYLVAACVPTGAWAGLVPTGRTLTRVGLLHDELVTTIARSSAPLASTPGIRFALAALLGVAALMVDILCTVLEAPAMVGLVLLPVLVLSGSTVRQPVSWLWFVLAGGGYLLILSTTGPSSRPWGREIGRRPDGAAAALVSGRRIAVAAVSVAVVLPWLVPGQGANLLSDAMHHGGGGGSGTGDGTGGVTEFASLRGSLVRGQPLSLLTVTVPGGLRAEPFYLRQGILDVYDGTGWRASGGVVVAPVGRSGLTELPPVPPAVGTVDFHADIQVSGLDGRPPVFADTVGAAGLPRGSSWNRLAGTVATSTVHPGNRYSLDVRQPAPSAAVLAASDGTLPLGLSARELGTPPVDPRVQVLTDRIVGSATNQYEKARALSQYFTTPSNGFTYSLNVPAGDSADDLTSFLFDSRQGFCQQYAAAMAVMLRVAGVPSRVVVGYSHTRPDKTGRFTVTTRDAHAWVEAYLGGVGWTSFDPTPLVGDDASRQVIVPYAPQSTQTGAAAAPSAAVPSAAGGPAAANNGRAAQELGPTGSTGAAAAGAGRAGGPPWWPWALAAGAVALTLLAGPALVRRRRRRRRAGATGPDRAGARWDELRDLCLDVGLGWSPTRTPRGVAAWLTDLGADGAAAAPLVTAVETSRYAAAPPATTSPPADDPADAALDVVTASVRRVVGRRARARAVLWPRSVVDPARTGARARWVGAAAALARRRPRLLPR